MVVGNGIFTPKCLSLNYIRKNIVVCDGGATESNALKSRYGIHYLGIREHDLWVCDTVNASLGLRYAHQLEINHLCSYVYQERIQSKF